MSNSTPPPPARVRTPPTPLHGAKYDPHEPYSPRRSSRLHAKRDLSPLLGGTTRLSQQTTPRKKPTVKRTSSQQFSPPSSPLSPSQQHPSSPFSKKSSRPSSTRREKSPMDPNSDPDLSDFRNQVSHPPKSRRNPQLPQGTLPTPMKTPRKRQLHHDPQLNSTARVLFQNHAHNAHAAVPSPRKARKARHSGFTLDPLDADSEHANDKIQIYTDSKERIPEEDNDEENPFLSQPRTSRSSKSASTNPVQKQTKNKTKHGMSKEVDEAVDRGEGMVYVFRGKKFFRRFEDGDDAPDQPTDEAQEAEESFGNAELRKQAGEAAHNPLPRSSLKPRLLFPPKEPTPDPDDVDEEAITDIEALQEPEQEHVTTPVKRSFYHPATPPTTGRKRKPPIDDNITANGHEYGDFEMNLDGASDYLQPPRVRSAKSKSNPFASWQRTKPAVSASESSSPDMPKVARAIKRQGETLSKTDDTGKRSRSD